MDLTQPVKDWVAALMSQLTLAGKFTCLCGWKVRSIALGIPEVRRRMYLLEFNSVFTQGANISTATAIVKARNHCRNGNADAGPRKRLGLPASWWVLQIHGAVACGAVFPEGITKA